MIEIVPTLKDNYTYVVHENGTVILIDCGEAKPVLNFLRAQTLKDDYFERDTLQPDYLFCTHHHADHIDGIVDLKKAYPSMKVYAPRKDLHRIPFADEGLENGQMLEPGGLKIECIETPGHTLNHLCYYMPDLKSVFTGDALFSMGCGRLFEGTPQDLFGSMQKLKSLSDETKIYFGHEYSMKNLEFTKSVEPDNKTLDPHVRRLNKLADHYMPSAPVLLGEEKSINLFLKADSVEKIAQLRQLRDRF